MVDVKLEMLTKLSRMAKCNEKYCNINDCAPTPYMDGCNRTIK